MTQSCRVMKAARRATIDCGAAIIAGVVTRSVATAARGKAQQQREFPRVNNAFRPPAAHLVIVGRAGCA